MTADLMVALKVLWLAETKAVLKVDKRVELSVDPMADLLVELVHKRVDKKADMMVVS